jgi:ankyrin repeat protein
MQLQYLSSFELDDDIKRSLGRLPPDLNTLYDELYGLLSTKPGQVQAAVFKNTLSWLLCARRTLKTEEFLCAISIDLESGRSVKVTSKDLVLKICNNFIVFDRQLDTFRFAHLSVREYLEQRPEYGNSTTNALAAEVCLWTVLSASSNIATEKLLLELGCCANALPATFEQLCTYADIYWPKHGKLAKEQRCSGKLKKMLQHLLLGLGGPGSTIALWNDRLRKHSQSDEYWDVRMPLKDTLPTVDSEMYISLLVSCAFDFEEFIGIELEDSSKAMQCVNKDGLSPLHIATRNGSCASLAKLLTLDQPYIKITQEVVVAAAENYNNGKEIMALLLDRRGDEIQITQEVVVAAAGNWNSGKEVIALLLDRRGDEVQITQEVVVAAAGHFNGREVLTLLLEQRGADVKITQAAVIAAARHGRKETIALLLDLQGSNIQITQEVVVAAAGNQNNGKEVIALLLDRRGDEVQITQEVVVAAACYGRKETIALLLDLQGSNIQITQEVVVAAAGNWNGGKEVIALLLDRRGDEVQITQEVVVAAAGNWNGGKEVIALLLNRRGDEVQITQEVVVAAAGNWNSGKEVMALLLDRRGNEVQITQEVVVAAAGNRFNGEEVMALLLNRRGDEVQITQEVVVAAAGNEDSGRVIKYLY